MLANTMIRFCFSAIVGIVALIAVVASGPRQVADAATVRAEDIKQRSESFLQDYLAARSEAKPAKSLELDGAWSGILSCQGRMFPISFDLDQSADGKLAGEVTIEPALGSGNARHTTPFSIDHVGKPASGDYVPAMQTFTLTVAAAADAPPAQARGLAMSGLLDPTSPGLALLMASETSAARSNRSCDAGFVARGGEADRMDRLAETIATMLDDRRPVVQTECPSEFRQWLERGSDLPTDTRGRRDVTRLLEDAYFEPVFGQPFRDMPAETLLAASAVISGSCHIADDAQRRHDHLHLGGALRDGGRYAAANFDHRRDRVIAAWTGWIDGELDRGAPLELAALVKMRLQQHIHGFRDDPAFEGRDARLAGLIDAAEEGDREVEFVERLEAAKGDFRALNGLRLEAVGRGDVDADVVARGLDYYLVDAATTLAEQAATPADAVYMASWARQYGGDGDCPALQASVCEKAARRFLDKALDLAERFVDAEEDAFEAIEDGGRALPDLARALVHERKLRGQYGVLTELDPFEDFNEDRRDHRRELQERLRDAIEDEIAATRTAPELRAIEHRYFIDDDLQARHMRPVRDALDAALAETRPFAGMAGADYFNALYNQDFAALRELDGYYLEGIWPLMVLGAQQAAAMGPLLDALTGARQGTAAAQAYRGVANLSALYAVLGTYLLEFPDVYAECLKPNAQTVVITTRTDWVTRDAFGNEVRRTEGWTTEDRYLVNPEFVGNFRALFGAAKGSAQAHLFDLFLNDGRITSLRAGMRSTMRETSCASPEIKQLEEGFLAYDRDVKRRLAAP